MIIYASPVYTSRVFPANMVIIENENYFNDKEEFIVIEVINKLDNTLISTNI